MAKIIDTFLQFFVTNTANTPKTGIRKKVAFIHKAH
jgi:hypothetical protein